MGRKIGLAFGGVVLGLLGLELVLRVAGFGYNLSHPVPKDTAADFKVFCVGESSTWGTGAKDRARDCYPKQLERLLAERYPGKKISCFFDQMIGQNTSENLAKLPSYIKIYEPDLIIFMVGINNWWNMDRSNILLFNKDIRISRLSLKTLVFLDSFRLWKLWKWFQSSRGRLKERWRSPWPQDQSLSSMIGQYEKTYGPDVWEIFNKLAAHDLAEMVKICRVNNIKVIICSYPGGYLGNLGFFQREVAKRHKVPFLGFFRIFRDLEDRGSYFAPDMWHPNEKGYALVARAIADCISKNEMIE